MQRSAPGVIRCSGACQARLGAHVDDKGSTRAEARLGGRAQLHDRLQGAQVLLLSAQRGSQVLPVLLPQGQRLCALLLCELQAVLRSSLGLSAGAASTGPVAGSQQRKGSSATQQQVACGVQRGADSEQTRGRIS